MNVMRAVRDVRPDVPGLSDSERVQLELRLFDDTALADDTSTVVAEQERRPPSRSWLRPLSAAAAALLVVGGVVALATVDRSPDPAPVGPVADSMPSEPLPPGLDTSPSSSVARDDGGVEVSLSTVPGFTELLVDPPPDGFDLFSARYQRTDSDGDVGIATYRDTGSGVVLELIVRSTPNFFDHLIEAGRRTWVVGERVVVNDGQLDECLPEYCSVGLQWNDRTAISLAWAAPDAATLGPEHTIERLVDLAADLVETPGTWIPSNLDPSSDTIHPDLLAATMNAALDGLPTVSATGTTPDRATTFEIDRGAAHGLQVGMPVVDATGVIGKITVVTDETSTVALIIDDTYTIAARAANGRSASFDAIASGDGSQLRLAPAPDGNDDPFTQPGTLVVTQGGPDSLAPPGLPIGVVTSAANNPPPHIRPSADIDNLDAVRVVLYRPAALQPD